MRERTEVLVTGGAGFIGSHVAEVLAKLGNDVTILDDLSGGYPENVPPGCNFIQGSILDDKLVGSIFGDHKFEVIYHLAAYAAEGLSPFIRRYNYTNNLVGSATLLNAAIRDRTRRFVFTSSIAVYGAGQVPMKEETIPCPQDPYGIAKRAVELDLQCASSLFGIEHVIFRPHNVYGERQNISDPYRNVIGIFMNKIMRGEPMPIFGDGSQTRAFTYVGDIAPIIAKAGFEPGAKNRIFNVGADEPVAVIDLAYLVADVFGAKARIQHLPPRHEALHAFSEHSTARAVFGELTNTPLRVGLERMASWARVRGPQAPRPFIDVEIMDGLPDPWSSLIIS